VYETLEGRLLVIFIGRVASPEATGSGLVEHEPLFATPGNRKFKQIPDLRALQVTPSSARQSASARVFHGKAVNAAL
jgi:hypothetical protein